MKFGSINNLLMSGTVGAPEPEVGGNGTLLLWTDRHPYTIIGVHRYKSGPNKGKVSKVWAQEDDVVWDKTLPGGMGHQNWVITPNKWGKVTTFTRRKDGAFRSKGGAQLRIGGDKSYYYCWEI